MRASGRRRVESERQRIGRRALVIDRRVQAEALDARRATGLQALASALAAHDPDRTLERGYALVSGADGEVVTSAAAARRAGDVSLRFSDAAVDATITGERDDRA
jgi:exodeoxyribonuclease VII large subunit